MWHPDLHTYEGPRYWAIAEALAQDVAAGRLKAGDQLPTHRELAEQLGLSLGTVTRAYAEAGRRGLVVGEVGRGTYVRDYEEAYQGILHSSVDPSLIDLSLLVPPRDAGHTAPRALATGLAALSNRSDLWGQLGYQPHAGIFRHREAGAEWLRRAGLPAEPADVLVCGCAQHASMVAFSTLTQPGDTVFTEELTNPGMKDLAAWLGLRLHGLPVDEEGLLPDAFEEACRNGAAKILYCMPVFHNPTTATMSVARREAIARIAQVHGIAIVEDGVHGLLVADPLPPVSAFAPERSYYVTSLSKTIAPGLRLGYLRAPTAAVPQLELAIRATLWMASPLLAELISTWIFDGTAARIVGDKRSEAAARQELAATVLAAWSYRAQPTSYHLWLPLPAPWRCSAFVTHAKMQGVAVTASEVFIPEREHAPHAVRVCLSAAPSRERLAEGLGMLAEMLQGIPQPGLSVV